MDRAAGWGRVGVSLGGAVLALLLGGAGNKAWSSAPPSPDPLEHAAALVRAGEPDSAVVLLRRMLAVDPSHRRAREILAFALESSGALADERRVRAALAADYPRDAGLVADYGRVLERAGDARGALRAYRRAQEMSPAGATPELDAAVERMNGRTAPEVGAPVTWLSDADAVSSRLQAGASLPLGQVAQLGVLASHETARARMGAAETVADRVTVSWADRPGGTADWSTAGHLHLDSPRGNTRRYVSAGGAVAGRAMPGSWFQAEGRAAVDAPWDEAAVAVLNGGRTSGAEVRLYAHARDRRLLLQVGGLGRRLSIVESPSNERAFAWQRLGVAGVDAVVWRRPAHTVRGEMLDERLIEPTTMSSSLTLAYRHYESSARSTPEFQARLGLVPRSSIDEGAITASLVSRGGRAGAEFRGALGRDAVRGARTWRAGGGVIWAPTSTTRLRLDYEEATEHAAGLAGRRHAGWMSLHVDL